METVSLLLLVLIGQSPTDDKSSRPVPYAVLEASKILDRETFWENQDREWFRGNIPLLETPDPAINTTFLYRWELVTRHLVYGSPANGYAFTEFMDRPFWSGQYGAISCPAGLQLSEVRWLRDPRFAWDYAKYWVKVPGAQPRNYSTWLADATWGVHAVHPDKKAVSEVYPRLVENLKGWESRHFVPEKGLFWQTGHDDGMEFNIQSRQTKDILRGAPALRPTINAYMWADERALARMARILDKPNEAQALETKAAKLRSQTIESLWDPEREFFFPRFLRDEENEGVKVAAGTLTYESGKHKGSPHGRELHGLVPWQFGMASPKHKSAWKFLMDPRYFFADYGPTTVERRDPMFLLQKWCCWWSGQSWPYATSQTLVALGRHLREERETVVTKADWFKLFEIYTKTHRKQGKPYIAEAANPFTGSFEGHDAPGHSEHYFHSSYNDLVVTGLAGIQPGDGDEVVIDPLAPPSWDYFALDGVPMKGHTISVIWDRSGRHYGVYAGLAVLVDGKVVAKNRDMAKLRVQLEPREPKGPDPRANFASLNDGGYFPRPRASSTRPGSMIQKAFDGQYWYSPIPVNRWVAESTDGSKPEWLSTDLGRPRTIREAKVYFLEEEGIAPPVAFRVQIPEGKSWKTVAEIANPLGRRATTIPLKDIQSREFRLELVPQAGKRVGIAEWELWGALEGTYLERTYQAPTLPLGNRAQRKPGEEFPKPSASMTSPYDKVEEINDGLVQFGVNPRNRWTSYTSKAKEDWVAVEFANPTKVGRVEIAIFDDRGGVQAPGAMRVETFVNGAWKAVEAPLSDPPQPVGGQWNEIRFQPQTTGKIRVVFTHKGEARSGISELLVWEE